MEIKSVAVLGAGAVGSYVIWGLSQKSDVRLGIVAEGARAERLKRDGCAINGKVYRPEVWTPQEAHDADLLIVSLKYGALPGAMESINNPNTHGTGCTLSSAIASNLAKGYDLDTSVERAKAYISGALSAMLDLGHGSGPMNHMFALNGDFVLD